METKQTAAEFKDSVNIGDRVLTGGKRTGTILAFTLDKQYFQIEYDGFLKRKVWEMYFSVHKLA